MSNQLLRSEILVWNIDINWIKTREPSEALSGYLSLVDLSNIFLINAVYKYQKGNKKAMLKSL